MDSGFFRKKKKKEKIITIHGLCSAGRVCGPGRTGKGQRTRRAENTLTRDHDARPRGERESSSRSGPRTPEHGDASDASDAIGVSGGTRRSVPIGRSRRFGDRWVARPVAGDDHRNTIYTGNGPSDRFTFSSDADLCCCRSTRSALQHRRSRPLNSSPRDQGN